MDRYVVLEYLAEGGMGAIYLGKKLGAGGFEKQVVLKQLLPEFTQQPEFIDLFLREARLSASLDHANIIHTIDLVTAGDEYFIVMEYLDGADLRTLLKRAKRKKKNLSAAAGVYVARELLSALAYAHNKVGPDGAPLRLIHRDVSPSNILISGIGEVKLTDFGIAKAATHNSVFYRVKGKVGYMSPEQARSEPLDARSDLYSMAVCIFEVITGERLFVNVGLTTSADEMYAKPVPRVSKKVPGLPTELDEVMFKALATEPHHRYQTASELQEAFLRVAHRHGLMLSASELADHLAHACGPPHTWRTEEGLEVEGDGEGTEQIDIGRAVSQTSDSGDLLQAAVIPSAASQGSMVPASVVNDASRRRARAKTSVTHLSRLQGVELTSLIKLGDEAPIDDDATGAHPLFDLDNLAQDADMTVVQDVHELRSRAQMASESTTAHDPADKTMPRPVWVGQPPIKEKIVATEKAERMDVKSIRAAQRPRSAAAKRHAPWVLWVFFAVMVAIGVGVATVIGFSGPSIDAAGDPAAAAPTAPAAQSPGIATAGE